MSNKIIFNGSTNYTEVFRISKLMVGDIVARGGKCCNTSKEKEALCSSISSLYAAQNDLTEGDITRFNNAVKSAYLTLYPFSYDKDYGYTP